MADGRVRASRTCDHENYVCTGYCKDLDAEGIVPGGDVAFYCTCCLNKHGSEPSAREHAASRKHARARDSCRRRRSPADAAADVAFEHALTAAGVTRVVAVGDCHGGRALGPRFSRRSRSYFAGGTAHAWASGRRDVAPLARLLKKSDRNDLSAAGARLVLVLSYGEIDVRCHAAKTASWATLADAYVAAVAAYAAAAAADLAAPVLAVLLPAPPPSDATANPRAPFVGALSDRVAATRALNAALAAACAGTAVRFPGDDAWAFAEAPDGSLRGDISDGHVHVLPDACRPLHARLRATVLAGLAAGT